MYEFVEPHVRRLVAEHLGVGTEELVPGISLRDDLAADSLDLVELAMALEAEFAIVMSEHILDRVLTYGDLVHAVGLLIRTRCGEAIGGARLPALSDFGAGAALRGRVPGEMSIGSPWA